MKYPKQLLLKLTDPDYQTLKQLADIRRTSAATLARQALLDLFQREGMDPLSDKKPPVPQEN